MNQVEIDSGRVAGSEADGIRVFRGIPFAAPPVGALRWRPPAPVAPWAGVRAAEAFGASPVQAPSPSLGGLPVAEDCLTLNVWTPARQPGEKLPVMVWLYGGGFTAGASASPRIDGAALAREGVVLVSVNYRVGVFGFLAHPALTAESPDGASGNYGLLDQIAALRWVQANIAGFGGDPSRVTLFGVSAGGACISLILASPLGAGLVHRAIIQSGGVFRPLARRAEAEEAGLRIMGADLAALRALPAGEVLARTGQFAQGARGLTTPRVLRPIIDGWSVVEDEVPAFLAGHFRAVPTLVGSNADEGGLFLDGLPIRSEADFRSYMERYFADRVGEALALYPAERLPQSLADVFGDTQFTYGARGIARTVSRREKQTFRYLFSRPAGSRRATHGDEVAYVFGTLGVEAGRAAGPVGAADRALSRAMMGAWVRFAASGDPNGSGLPRWAPYETARDNYLDFDDPIREGAGWRPREMAFLDRYFDWEKTGD